MIPRKGGDGQAPSPELLAAYADGELERESLSALRGQVEDWLSAHPDAAVEVAAQRRLRDLYRSAPVPEPTEAAWADVLARVATQITQTPAARSRVPLARALTWSAAAAAAAAAVWLVVTWFPRGGEPAPNLQHGQNTEVAKQEGDRAALPVASADEVEVLSVAGADTASLVVGHLPLQGPMVLAGPGDVTVTSAPENVVQGGPAPFIWGRTEGELQEEDPEQGPPSEAPRQ